MAKILLVDDSRDLVDFLSTLLKTKKHEVQAASSKHDILNCIDGFMPDLILMDIRLKNENGKEICRELKANRRYRSIPIILISADPDLLRHFAECHADDAIEKPFENQALINKINRHLNERVFISM